MKTAQTSGRATLGLRALIVLLLAVFFTLLCVWESGRIGRLMTSPTYDDVLYFHEGALLTHAVKSDGLPGFWSFLEERNLHSPYSIFLAAAAFTVFGFRDSSPYLASGLVVLAYLSCLGWQLRRLPTAAWVTCLALFLTVPFITMGVVEFRPDIAWALASGFGAVLIVTSTAIFRKPGHAAFAGLLLALALLIKPSAFPMTILLYTGAIVSRVVEAIWECRWRSGLRQFLPGAICFTATALVIAGPYWARFGKVELDYFVLHVLGDHKDVWAFQGSLSQSLLYYITGDGAKSNVALSGLILSLLSLACLVHLARKRPDMRWKLLVLVGLMAGALVVNTLARTKTPVLGGGIYGVWIFASAHVIAGAYQLPQSDLYRWVARWRMGALVIAALTALACYRWPKYSDWSGRAWGGDSSLADNYRSANNFIQGLLEQHRQAPPQRVLFTQAGPVIYDAAAMWFPTNNLKEPAHWGDTFMGAYIRSEDEFRKAYPEHEWIVLQEQGVMGAPINMPSETLLPRFLEIVRADPDYGVIGEFTARDGKKVWVYARQPKS